MTKNEIADVLSEIALLLELQGDNPFKVRAYQTGARALEGIEESELATLIAEDRLQDVKGIGEALGKKIAELHTTGRLEFVEKLRASVEPGLVQMVDIPGLGPKKIKALRDKLGITTIAALDQACCDGRVAELAGFGAKTQEKILAGIKNREAYGRRHLWWDAWALAEPIVAGLRSLPQVIRAEAAGSLRRRMETVGDIDFIVSASQVTPVVDWFVALPGVKEVTARGETKASVRFETGLQADLRIVPDEQFVFALHHFTGSKDHNVQMRQRALARGLSLSEWGLTRVVREEVTTAAPGEEPAVAPQPRPKVTGPSTPSVVSPKDEAALFAALGLRFVPPELREGMGEIEAAERGEFQSLIDYTDLRGAFHNHTTASDGRNTLAEMVAAAQSLGWEYLGIADHSKSSVVANGLTEERLLYQVKEIRALNASRRFSTHVFAGVECDILADGELDFDSTTLSQLDYVVASVHSQFAQDEATMTRRIVRAIEHPCTTMLGHLTGRLLLRRDGYRVDVAKVIDAAIAHGVIIELNANPYRLDMDWRHWRRAAGRGLLCSINPDAHDGMGLAHVVAGVNAARKGGLRAADVLNTKSVKEVQSYFAARADASRI